MTLAYASNPDGVNRFAESPPVKARLLNAVEIWCRGLQAKRHLPAILADVLEGLEARSLRLSRQPAATGARVRSLSVGARASVPAAGAAAPVGLGRVQARLRPAAVWFTSAAADGTMSVLPAAPWRGPSADAAVVVLAVEQGWVDRLEIQFAAPIGQPAQARLFALADRLSASWSQHGADLLSETLRLDRTEAPSRSRPAGPSTQPILGTANPARLTRAEFRLCILLSRGLDPEGARAELGISRSMLRAHLRSILAKTGISSLRELLSHLQTSRQDRTAPPTLPQFQEA